ncbi:MAG: type II toxin-antitoxin system VapC family toxin [Planctomycetia bacterium]|nr:type II toxin-antitoxin system VapC family toxin [Planctomycetia bacterium]
MSFLLDTDICSAHLKRPSGLSHRFVQHGGGLFISAVALAELYTWAYRRRNPAKLLSLIENDLLADLAILDFDRSCALRFAQLQSELLKQGSVVNAMDLMIAAIALVHDLTLVTHNTRHFEVIPGLRIVDWLSD